MATAFFYTYSKSKVRKKIKPLFKCYNAFSGENALEITSQEAFFDLLNKNKINNPFINESLLQFFSFAIKNKWIIRIPHQTNDNDLFMTSSNKDDIFPAKFYYNIATLLKNAKIWLILIVLFSLLTVMMFSIHFILPSVLSIRDGFGLGIIFCLVSIFLALEFKISGEFQ